MSERRTNFHRYLGPVVIVVRWADPKCNRQIKAFLLSSHCRIFFEKIQTFQLKVVRCSNHIYSALQVGFFQLKCLDFSKKILQCDDNKKALICLLHFGSAHQSLQLYLMKESRVSSAEIALTSQNFRFTIFPSILSSHG